MSKGNQGIQSRNTRHIRAPKIEPRSRAKNPAGVSQLGNHIGSHVTSARGGDTGYRGQSLERGQGYNPPVGPTNNVAAVGVGGGRTVYRCGSQQAYGNPNPGNPASGGDPLEHWKR